METYIHDDRCGVTIGDKKYRIFGNQLKTYDEVKAEIICVTTLSGIVIVGGLLVSGLSKLFDRSE